MMPKPPLQHPRRGSQRHLGADREQIHPQDRGVADAGQRLGEAADLPQGREEGVEDHADEQRHDHQATRNSIDRLVNAHGSPAIGHGAG
jgi:hypothetical protein